MSGAPGESPVGGQPGARGAVRNHMPDPPARWRAFADYCKRRPWMLKAADRIGRGRGVFRLFDFLRPDPPAPNQPDLDAFARAPLAAVNVGHATNLIRLGGSTVMTDPVFWPRVGMTGGLLTMGPRRRMAPAVPMGRLPPADVILLSHAHFDHLDRPTLARLDRSATVVCADRCGDLVRDLGYRRVIELDWLQGAVVGNLLITAWPVKHWTPRVFFDTWRTCCGFVVESYRHKVLYAGDTAHCDCFDAVRGCDLAIFGIGAYNPFRASHACPEEAWDMAKRAGAARFLPMHHSVFKLSYEPMAEPLERVRAAAAADPSMQLVGDGVGKLFTLD